MAIWLLMSVRSVTVVKSRQVVLERVPAGIEIEHGGIVAVEA